jgi:hypothetical protein
MSRKTAETAEFGLDPLKAVFQAIMIAGILVLAGWPLVSAEARDAASITPMAILLLVGGYMAFLLIRDLRAGNPVIVVARDGLHDRRSQQQVIPWSDIEEIQVRRMSFMPGLRVELRNGERREIDTILLSGKARQILEAARVHLERQERAEERTERRD